MTLRYSDHTGRVSFSSLVCFLLRLEAMASKCHLGASWRPSQWAENTGEAQEHTPAPGLGRASAMGWLGSCVWIPGCRSEHRPQPACSRSVSPAARLHLVLPRVTPSQGSHRLITLSVPLSGTRLIYLPVSPLWVLYSLNLPFWQ